MDVEHALISKAVQAGVLEDLISRGIDPDHFADPECREVFEFGLGFMHKHKSTPSTKIIKEEFPEFTIEVSKDPLSWHMERFVLQVKERMSVELVRDYMDSIEDPDELPDIELRALDMARQLTEVIPAPQAERFSEGSKRREIYEKRQSQGEIHGILLGIPTFDEMMLGIQPHELMTIAAYMGVGKSLLMGWMAYNAYLQGKTALFISLEMEAEALLRRLDVMASNVRYHALKALELDQGEKKKWERILEQAEQDKHERDIIIRDDITNCTVDHVMAETMRYKPDLVFVDYLEQMRSPRGTSSSHWEQVSYNGMGLKQNARVMKIPHITAAQLSREGGRGEVTLASVGYQSIGKHSDLMIGLNQDEEMEARQEMKALLLKNRDGPKKSVMIRWQLEHMEFGEKGIEELFPRRKKTKSMIGPERRKAKRLEIARVTGGRDNPFSSHLKDKKKSTKKTNPWTAKAA